MYLDTHIVACVAVLSLYSTSPAVVEVECENITSDWLGTATRFRLEVSWSEETARKAQRLLLTVQTKPLVEMAAVALALILVHDVVPLGRLATTDYGERADYRSRSVPSVLEISGTESLSELARRHWEKVAQALASPLSLDAYIVVCAFSTQGHRIKFSFHRREVSPDG
jgi:hypothetical protein